MIEIVNRNHGIINKFLGDGFMAVFGAPLSDGADCAKRCSIGPRILCTRTRRGGAGKDFANHRWDWFYTRVKL
jgi:adenylate cyclase